MGKTAERMLRSVFHLCRYHAWVVLVIALGLTGASLYYIRQVPLRSSYFDLLPQDDPLVDQYRKNAQYLAETDYIALLLTVGDAETKSQDERERLLLGAAEALAEVLRQDSEFLEVRYLVEPSPRIPDQYLLLYQLGADRLAQVESSVALTRGLIAEEGFSLPPTDLTTAYRKAGETITGVLSGKLNPGSVGKAAASVEEDLRGLIALNNVALGAITALDRFPTLTAAIQNLASIFVPTRETPRTPVGFFSDDRSRLLMSVRPCFPSQRGVTYCTLVVKALRADLARVDLRPWDITVGVAGTYAFNAETNAIVNGDMRRTTLISSGAVLAVFFLGFGSLFYTVIAAIPLLISMVLTTAWAKFAAGGFNLMTSFLPALVFGLGIEYGIHFISRYAEERGKGRPLNRALSTAVLRKGEAVFAGAMTTAVAFLGLLFSRSRALFEMGLISSMGIVIAFVTTLFLFPTLVTLSHFLFRFRHKERITNYASYVSPFFRFVSRKGRAIVVIVLLLTCVVALQASHTAFRFTSADLVPRTESQAVLEDALAHFGATQTQLGSYFTFFASSEEELGRVVEHLKESPLVETVESARDLLPVNLTKQQQVLNTLNMSSYIDQLDLLDRSLAERGSALVQMRGLFAQFSLAQYAAALYGMGEIALASDEIQRQLRALQAKLEALDAEQARAAIASLKEALRNLEKNLAQIRALPPVDALLKDILDSLPEGIRPRYMTRDGKYIVRARMSGALLEGTNLRDFDASASSFSSDYFSMALGIPALEHYMKRDFIISTALAAFLIAVILWMSLRGWMRPLLAATPLILSYVWMLGGMRVLRIPFNFINITISPLLIGVGVDNGVYLVVRYLEERTIDPQGAVERSGKTTSVAVIVTSLTTLVVFGSLLFARTPGLRVLGICALLGMGFALLFSLLFLPAALRAEGGKRV
jgi:hypothetical protein